jgi:nitroreductase/NAD-dependent dihydropyrimidine dehydrogenase PreA subunit
MPTINLEKCTQCLKCVKDCPSSAIDINSGFIAGTCIHCGHCVAICPESTIYPDFGIITPLVPSKISPADFQNLSAGIRSIRYYLKKEVPEEIIQILIENMKHYSSAGNARPLKITLVRSQEKIQLLNDLTIDTLIKTMKLVTSPMIKPLLKVFAPSIRLTGLKEYKEILIRKRHTNNSMVCHHAPLVMLFHGPVNKFDMSEADAYIWATNTILYAKTFGLGSCYIGFIVKAMQRNKTMKKEMNIPASHKVYAALVLGHPKVNYKNETSRKRPEVNFV